MSQVLHTHDRPISVEGTLYDFESASSSKKALQRESISRTDPINPVTPIVLNSLGQNDIEFNLRGHESYINQFWLAVKVQNLHATNQLWLNDFLSLIDTCTVTLENQILETRHGYEMRAELLHGINPSEDFQLLVAAGISSSTYLSWTFVPALSTATFYIPIDLMSLYKVEHFMPGYNFKISFRFFGGANAVLSNNDAAGIASLNINEVYLLSEGIKLDPSVERRIVDDLRSAGPVHYKFLNTVRTTLNYGAVVSNQAYSAPLRTKGRCSHIHLQHKTPTSIEDEFAYVSLPLLSFDCTLSNKEIDHHLGLDNFSVALRQRISGKYLKNSVVLNTLSGMNMVTFSSDTVNSYATGGDNGSVVLTGDEMIRMVPSTNQTSEIIAYIQLFNEFIIDWGRHILTPSTVVTV